MTVVIGCHYYSVCNNGRQMLAVTVLVVLSKLLNSIGNDIVVGIEVLFISGKAASWQKR